MQNYAPIYIFATFCHENYTFYHNSAQKYYKNHKAKLK